MKTTHQRNHVGTHRSGFTLLELLIVISIIAILAAIAFPATSMVMNQARKAQAESQVAGIVNAVKLYETQYSVLPLGNSPGEQEIPTDSEFVDILTGVDTDNNTKEISFLEGKQAKKASGSKPARSGFVNQGNGSSSLVDPWGNFYMVILDANYDDEIKVPGTETPIRTKVVAWSFGKPDDSSDYKSARKNTVKDWLASWN